MNDWKELRENNLSESEWKKARIISEKKKWYNFFLKESMKNKVPKWIQKLQSAEKIKQFFEKVEVEW